MLKFLLVILIIIVLIIVWLISTYNGLVRSRNTVDEAYSTMDVYLKKRFDLIPNLVEAVKGGRSGMVVEAPLIVYREKGVYTDEILSIYGIG